LQKGDVYYAVARFGFDPLPFGTRHGGVSLSGVAPSGRTDIHGSTSLTYKGKLPDSIARAMQEWRRGQRVSFPKAYITYHEKAARKTLKDLQRNLGFEIHKTWMAPSGWLDGMNHLHAIVRTRKGNRLVEIAWHDSHGGGQWMEVGAGQFLISESALEGFGAVKKLTQAQKRRIALDKINEVLEARDAYLETLHRQGAGQEWYFHQLAKNKDGIHLAASLFLYKYKQFGRGLKALRQQIKREEAHLRKTFPRLPEVPTRTAPRSSSPFDVHYHYDRAYQLAGMKEALRIAEGHYTPKRPEETL
jgi:hypothetical protein